MASVKRKFLIGFILCVYLNFIIIALQPFGTDQFEAEYRFLLLSGFGIVTFGVYLIHSCIENIWYYRKKQVWTVSYEICSTLIFCLFSGTIIYVYNALIVNQTSCTAETYWLYLRVTVACMIPVFVPPMLYLRQKLGEQRLPVSSNSVILTGENKNEILRLEKEELLFVKAVENTRTCGYLLDQSPSSQTLHVDSRQAAMRLSRHVRASGGTGSGGDLVFNHL